MANPAKTSHRIPNNHKVFTGKFTDEGAPIFVSAIHENILVWLLLHGTSFTPDIAKKCYNTFATYRSKLRKVLYRLVELRSMGALISIDTARHIMVNNRRNSSSPNVVRGWQRQPTLAWYVTALGEEIAKDAMNDPNSRVSLFSIEMSKSKKV